jgi:hypothetical protein
MQTLTPQPGEVKTPALSITISPDRQLDKKQYNAFLREQWSRAKKEATDNPNQWGPIYKEALRSGMTACSMTGFVMAAMAMKAQNLDGFPYIDAKTFQGWRKSGYKVNKGEKSFGGSIVWLHPKSKTSDGTEEEQEYCYPKAYHLFHRTQVTPLGDKAVKQPVKVETSTVEAKPIVKPETQVESLPVETGITIDLNR